MKEEILSRFSGQYCSIADIVAYIEDLKPGIPRQTIIWNVSGLSGQGKAVRVGRGVYGFVPMNPFRPVVGEAARKVGDILQDKFKYLVATITDTSVLGQFMNLQPFSTVVVLEVRKSATGAVLSALRKEGLDAYEKTDYPKIDQYISSLQPILVRPELSVNPKLPLEGNIRTSTLEKLLVDLVCDEDIFGQYQGEELKNIYQNATERYAINFSQMLKYAAARKKKAPVRELLEFSNVYRKVRSLL